VTKYLDRGANVPNPSLGSARIGACFKVLVGNLNPAFLVGTDE
jgi:hypothetical protein